MNIKEAKEQIKYAVKSYFTKNEFGDFVIPTERQRPIFLMGAPGIGKTAIMEQIANELGIGIVSYSMTHHTRQSALGLPFIVHKTYNGKEYDVSEYTMSEIIASVYEMIENDGTKEGILFLDEINCVSETLAPSMLQFLQYKIFGKHKVPDGWIIVTAGNPPEYNNSVREFDIVTWDRLKRINIEPDFEVWKEYAYKKSVHPAIITYLEIKKNDFYVVETSLNGKSFVTARGWIDLSDMIKLFEHNKFKVDETLVEQYLQNKQIAKNFAIYYDLFNKYRADYQIDKILSGEFDESVKERAENAKFDERLSLLGLLLDALTGEIKKTVGIENTLRIIVNEIKEIKQEILSTTATNTCKIILNTVKKMENTAETGKHSGSLSEEKVYTIKKAVKMFENMSAEVLKSCPENGEEAFAIMKAIFDAEKKNLGDMTKKTISHIDNVFDFCDNVFSDGQESLILVTELTADPENADFVNKKGCQSYFKHNKDLLFYERNKEIITQIQQIDV